MSSQEGIRSASAATPFDNVQVLPILTIGDSKTAGADTLNPTRCCNTWPLDLSNALNASNNPGKTFFVTNVGQGGVTSTYWRNNIDVTIAPFTDYYKIVLYQIGVNEFGSIDEATWISNVEYVIDAIHNRWPGAEFILSDPWKCAPTSGTTCTQDATADTYATWVAQVLADRPAVVQGDDERAWFKPNVETGGDTYSNDPVGPTYGLHFYTALGQAQKVTQMRTVLGF